jgi:hypothetical protein
MGIWISEDLAATRSIHDFEAELFDDWIGEDIAGDFFDLLPRFFRAESIEGEDEELSLPDVLNFIVAEGRQGMLDGLTLRIEHGLLQHYPNMRFHRRDYTSPEAFRPARNASNSVRFSSGGRKAR